MCNHLQEMPVPGGALRDAHVGSEVLLLLEARLLGRARRREVGPVRARER